MESFFSLLERHVQVSNSLLCVGLDPHPDDLPEPTAEAALDYCLGVVRATARYAAAFKPNAAFFELFGADGWQALQQVIKAVRAESQRIGSVIPVILDAKRGDIASTAAAYAASAFYRLGAHAITLSPFLGRDSVDPFIADRERGVFLLCKTSNPGADDFQEAVLADGAPLYEHVARRAQAWNQDGNVGLVVGATQLAALAHVRAVAPELWFLAPGVGAQGGDLEAALAAGLRSDGLGMLIAVSRGIARAPDPAQAAADLRDRIETSRQAASPRRATASQPPGGPTGELTDLAAGLLEAGCVRLGSFTLKSGQQSPIYLDLRRLVSYPAVMKLAARAYAAKLRELDYDRLAGLPYAALPIGAAVSLETGRPLIYPRREVKDYGTQAAIEGEHRSGETVVVLDDLATTGGTKIEAIAKLEAAGLIVKDIVVLIDRQQGAKESLAAAGYRMHAIATLGQLLEIWAGSGAITAAQRDQVIGFLRGAGP